MKCPMLLVFFIFLKMKHCCGQWHWTFLFVQNSNAERTNSIETSCMWGGLVMEYETCWGDIAGGKLLRCTTSDLVEYTKPGTKYLRYLVLIFEYFCTESCLMLNKLKFYNKYSIKIRLHFFNPQQIEKIIVFINIFEHNCFFFILTI